MGEAKEDWAILRALSEVLGKRLPYDTREALRAAILADAPQFGDTGVLPPQPGADVTIWEAIGTAGAVDTTTALGSTISDFYMTNPIARASATMAECSRIFVHGDTRMAAE